MLRRRRGPSDDLAWFEKPSLQKLWSIMVKCTCAAIFSRHYPFRETLALVLDGGSSAMDSFTERLKFCSTAKRTYMDSRIHQGPSDDNEVTSRLLMKHCDIAAVVDRTNLNKVN